MLPSFFAWLLLSLLSLLVCFPAPCLSLPAVWPLQPSIPPDATEHTVRWLAASTCVMARHAALGMLWGCTTGGVLMQNSSTFASDSGSNGTAVWLLTPAQCPLLVSLVTSDPTVSFSHFLAGRILALCHTVHNSSWVRDQLLEIDDAWAQAALRADISDRQPAVAYQTTVADEGVARLIDAKLGPWPRRGNWSNGSHSDAAIFLPLYNGWRRDMLLALPLSGNGSVVGMAPVVVLENDSSQAIYYFADFLYFFSERAGPGAVPASAANTSLWFLSGSSTSWLQALWLNPATHRVSLYPPMNLYIGVRLISAHLYGVDIVQTGGDERTFTLSITLDMPNGRWPDWSQSTCILQVLLTLPDAATSGAPPPSLLPRNVIQLASCAQAPGAHSVRTSPLHPHLLFISHRPAYAYSWPGPPAGSTLEQPALSVLDRRSGIITVLSYARAHYAGSTMPFAVEHACGALALDPSPATMDAVSTGSLRAESVWACCGWGFLQRVAVCPAGSQVVGDSSTFECRLCDAGHLQPLPSQTSCPLCANGSFNNDTGAQTCAACPDGWTNEGNYTTACPLRVALPLPLPAADSHSADSTLLSWLLPVLISVAVLLILSYVWIRIPLAARPASPEDGARGSGQAEAESDTAAALREQPPSPPLPRAPLSSAVVSVLPTVCALPLRRWDRLPPAAVCSSVDLQVIPSCAPPPYESSADEALREQSPPSSSDACAAVCRCRSASSSLLCPTAV
jgi:hypothetical protein